MGYITKHNGEKYRVKNALQDFSKDLTDFLNPIEMMDTPIICAGLLVAYRTLRENMSPGLKHIEEMIEEDIEACGIVIKCGGKKE